MNNCPLCIWVRLVFSFWFETKPAACPYFILTLCLLVSSADNMYANGVDPDQARQNVGFDLTP